MISDPQQRKRLEQAVELIMSCVDDPISHKAQSVYLSVAGDYCRQVAEVERRKSLLDDDFKRKETLWKKERKHSRN